MSFTLNNLGFLIRNFNLFKTKKLATNIPVFCKVYFHEVCYFGTQYVIAKMNIFNSYFF